jgi:hypothetical protein
MGADAKPQVSFADDLVCRAVEAGATNPPGRSTVHGEEHWKAVAILGLAIAGKIGASPKFVVTFAVLHDIEREGDDDDPKHGARAAALFRRLARGLDGLPPEMAKSMLHALTYHSAGTTTPLANAAACWDADRLDLYRFGRRPADRYLSAAASKAEPARGLAQLLALWREQDGPLPSWGVIEAGGQELRAFVSRLSVLAGGRITV